MRIKQTREFSSWHESLSIDLRRRIDARFDSMRLGHFGDSKSLGDGLFELRWKIGLRVYFSRRRIAGIDTIILWGGFKGSQDSDIAKARRIKARSEYELSIEEEKKSDAP